MSRLVNKYEIRDKRSVRSLTPMFLIAISVAVAVLFGPPKTELAAQEVSGASAYGQFCSSCHQPTGAGVPGTFPPLAGNENAADASYVEATIRDGLTGAIEVDGVSYDMTMPPVAGISDLEITAVVAYVVELSGKTITPVEPPVITPYVGDSGRGKDLFTGAIKLENDGGSCAGCHTAGSVGNLGGSSLGPDLSDTHSTLGGDVGLSAWLTNPPARTMAPIFADRPMNDEEIADLVAFMSTTSITDAPHESVDKLLLFGLVGMALLIGAMAIAWPGMRQTYVQRLRSKR
jgi:ubiquinol-cytochrome c reductase cytochrome c subunit